MSSCAHMRHVSITKKIRRDKALFIAMPQSSFTFENIAPQVYTALVAQFRRMGYYLVDNVQDSDYRLVSSIDNLSCVRRYISPDVLLFNYSYKLDISCALHEKADVRVKDHKFTTSTIVSKARSPIVNSSFLAHEHKKLASFIAPKIELFFRSCFVDS